MVQSLRYCGMMAYRGLSLLDVFWLSCHLLPRTLVSSITWGFLIAIIWVYHRWRDEQALTVMQSYGVSPWFFNQPAVFLSLILMVFLYAITLYIVPITAEISHQYSQKIQGKFDPSFITAGVYCSFKGNTLYAHQHPSRYHLQGVFLHNYKDPEKEFILCGQSARITPHKNGFFVLFENGSIQVFPGHKTPYLAHFKTYTFHYNGPDPALDQRWAQRPEDFPQSKLWHHWKHPSSDTLLNKIVEKEIRYRLFYPALVLLDALWIPVILLQPTILVWPLLLLVLCLHGGMLSSLADWVLFLALILRCVFWIIGRKKFY